MTRPLPLPPLFSTNAWAPLQLVLAQADALLARTAAQNAAAAVSSEGARRIGWKAEESEFLVMSDAADVFRAARARRGA